MADVARCLEIVLRSVNHKLHRKATITIVPSNFAHIVAKGIEDGWRTFKSFNCNYRLSRRWDRDPFADEARQSCRRFSIAEIKASTNNFDSHLVVGQNEYTRIYRGLIESRRYEVAVKRWKNGKSSESLNIFNTEIRVGSKLCHIHVVSIIGYCIDRDELIIVYEYMVNGSLSNHLYRSNGDPLPWEQRLEISIGAARGLLYLHADARHPIIHRNLKTTSILLDNNWTAKIGGLSFPLVVSEDSDNNSFENIVEGAVGYICPEYLESGRCGIKSDVYSFGVILLELVCCRRPMMINLNDKIAPECLKVYISIVENCVSDDGSKRSSMEDVLDNLRCAMRIQQKWQSLNQDTVTGTVFGEDP